MGIRSNPHQTGSSSVSFDGPCYSLSEAEQLYRMGRSKSLAAACLDNGLSSGAERTRLEIFKAMAQFDVGDVTSSLARLGNLAADESNDTASRFEACLALFLRVSDFETADRLLPYLTDLRQLAALRGNARSLASLHLAVARLEGLRGLFSDAY